MDSCGQRATLPDFTHTGQALVKSMLKPLVIYPSLWVNVVEQQDEGIVLALESLEESGEARTTPSQVYSKLLMALKTLHAHLLGMEPVDGEV